MPELLNPGVRLQGKQFQIGFSVGTMPVKDESMLSISGDLFFHFGGLSELSDRRLWYIRAGVDYLEDETETVYNNYYFFNPRVGRDFNISKTFGIEIDIGPAIQISHKHEDKTSSSSWDIHPTVFPGIGITLFYKF